MIVRGLKRVVASGGLTALLAATAFANPAAASVKGTCFIDGEMKMQDKDQSDLGMRLSGGQGKFTFRSLLVNCLADRDKDLVPDLSSLAIRASGWFDNTVCGTGKAFGTIDEVLGAQEGSAFWKARPSRCSSSGRWCVQVARLGQTGRSYSENL